MPLPSRLSFLTWNLAMLERAANAPLDWGQEHTQAEVRDVVLAASPDLVLFQELPGVVPYVETHDMVRANPMSHSGNLATLVGNHLLEIDSESESPAPTVAAAAAPTIATIKGCAILTTFGNALTVANVHLAPGSGGADLRLEQLEQILATSPTEALVVIGDTNCRNDEESAISKLGFSGDRPPAPTWNSKRNRFRASGPQFTAYFTRCFTAGPISVTDMAVLSDRTVDVGSGPFHLSDHYAMTGTIVLESQPS